MKAVYRPNLSFIKQAMNIHNSGFKINFAHLATNLKYAPCIYYPVRFHKDREDIKTLIDLSNKINVIHPVYAKKIGFSVKKIDIDT